MTQKISKVSEENNFKFIDAPITGSKLGAENGKLMFMVGGDKELVEKHKDDIVKILEENSILSANLSNPSKHINWHLYKSADLYIENGMGTAKIILSGWERSKENSYQNPFVLWFERKNRKWYLIVKDGHLTTAVSSSDEAHNLSPEIHEAFTTLFPHIEFEDWRKWKDPVLKKLALIRLKSVLPQDR